MRVHRIMVLPTGKIEYRITNSKEPEPYRKQLVSADSEADVEDLVEHSRKELELDIANLKIA